MSAPEVKEAGGGPTATALQVIELTVEVIKSFTTLQEFEACRGSLIEHHLEATVGPVAEYHLPALVGTEARRLMEGRPTLEVLRQLPTSSRDGRVCAAITYLPFSRIQAWLAWWGRTAMTHRWPTVSGDYSACMLWHLGDALIVACHEHRFSLLPLVRDVMPVLKRATDGRDSDARLTKAALLRACHWAYMTTPEVTREALAEAALTKVVELRAEPTPTKRDAQPDLPGEAELRAKVVQ